MKSSSNKDILAWIILGLTHWWRGQPLVLYIEAMYRHHWSPAPCRCRQRDKCYCLLLLSTSVTMTRKRHHNFENLTDFCDQFQGLNVVVKDISNFISEPGKGMNTASVSPAHFRYMCWYVDIYHSLAYQEGGLRHDNSKWNTFFERRKVISGEVRHEEIEISWRDKKHNYCLIRNYRIVCVRARVLMY